MKIQSFSRVLPMVYAYTTPGVSYHDGWVKIGYTEKQKVEERIEEQTHTVGIEWKLAWKNHAMYTDGSGEFFTDHQFHRYLTKEKQVERQPKTEWFHVDAGTSRDYFDEFASRKISMPETGEDYTLREEQARAVDMTKKYFENGGTEFLWNAKPRFGKTLSAYELIQQMGCQNVLVVSNRPSISNSWAEDFRKFIQWRGEYCFVSDTDALSGKPGVLTRAEYSNLVMNDDKRMIAFESLQGLKGSVYFGGEYNKLEWMAKSYTDGRGIKHHGLDFDLLIVDESQEGVDTVKTDKAFRNISRKHTLYLSGTPFKALANERFREDQIFNWSYADEQEAKASWNGEEFNPYEALPRLALYTYQLSPMIFEEVKKGYAASEDKTIDYAFDLNEFFATNEAGKFEREDEVKKFLHALSTQEKYPFSTPELRQELSHTLWLLNRVASAKALCKLLHDDPVFGEYKIVLAAGDGKTDEDEARKKSYDAVKEAIANNDKTITLSVGQLTVGVTIPEWSGVLMLCNMTSPSSYMQAAFRAQNPCSTTKNGVRLRKETAYIFDFDPARTLIVFDDFANNLSISTAGGKGTGADRKENIKRLLNFFPVLGEDSEGKMIELDAAQVLSIPRRIKCQEVVRSGFRSNFLFKNISNVFGAPSIVREIVEKLTPAPEEPKKRSKDTLNPLDHMEDINVNKDGSVDIPKEKVIGTAQDLFGPKFYEEEEKNVTPLIDEFSNNTSKGQSDETEKGFNEIKEFVKNSLKDGIVAPVVDKYDLGKRDQNQIEKQVDEDIDKKFDPIYDDYLQQSKIAKIEHDQQVKQAESPEDIKKADERFQANTEAALNNFVQAAKEQAQNTINNKPQEVIEQAEKKKAEKEKSSIEDAVRDHLRGFCRTIPSFIMAYGDGKLTLGNFDDYTEDDVFQEVTGITEDDFRFLRDGGDYIIPETGETGHFDGHLFDEVVFDDSIKEFWNKKIALADYFDESHEEDIFDYIPPQKTNQIFTPKWVVAKMVDELEENNPGCFDDPTNTFADLYMKSGLYITEIVKRLFRGERMKEIYPDDKDRVRHILREQVYGMAPSRIIYLIATNYILGFDEELKSETKNFVQADAAEAAKEDKLAELVDEKFGR